MRKKRVYIRFEGIIESIQTIKKKQDSSVIDYQNKIGMCEILYSKTTRYTRLFAIFKETSWPSHNFKTTVGIVKYNHKDSLILTTRNHIYTFKIKRIYLDNSKNL